MRFFDFSTRKGSGGLPVVVVRLLLGRNADAILSQSTLIKE
jgi:hypothetical protein